MIKNKLTRNLSIASCAVALLLGGCSDDGDSSTGAASSTRATDQTIENPAIIIGSSTDASPSSLANETPSPQPAPAPAPETTTSAS